MIECVELKPDDGIRIELERESCYVKCSYLGFYNDRLVLCIDFASPTATSPVKRFVESYARVRGARYAVVISGEEMWIYDCVERKEVKAEEVEILAGRPSADEKDLRIAAAYYSLIHCRCGVDNEGNSVCGLSSER
ncbi:hypothetical protein [Archaeoglobus neptunius]|uniref:hypothetical protein n=1 Tax=Archaeoglobus neptunius TaxID=2798580 RepID=UPI00192857CE|nr:hypothetical protein [Archaeoglobus neptunius]